MTIFFQQNLAFVANKTRLKEFDDSWETIAPFMLDYNYTIPESDYKKIAKLVKSHYLGEKKFDETTIKQLIQLFSDRLIVYPLGESAMLQARATKNPVRFYIFSYRGAHSLTEGISGSKKNFGKHIIRSEILQVRLILSSYRSHSHRRRRLRFRVPYRYSVDA